MPSEQDERNSAQIRALPDFVEVASPAGVISPEEGIAELNRIPKQQKRFPR